MPLNTLWREPLLHFLLIGAGLFGLYALQNDIQSEAPKRVVVTPGQIEQLAARFERTWSRKPTAEEIDSMIEGHVREEIFYREALAMGLDQNDPLVRRRMLQKLEFMLEDLSAATVDESAVEQYFAQNREDYRVDARISFRQVYLDPSRHSDLEAALAGLRNELSNGADPGSLGDRTMLAASFELAPEFELTRNFGADFTRRLVEAPLSAWAGPIFSAFGAHLVRIDQRIDARLPSLAEVEAEVRRDYQVKRQLQQKDLAYRRLREGYEVSVATNDGDQP